MKMLFKIGLILTTLTQSLYACCGIDNSWYINGNFGMSFSQDLPASMNHSNATGRLGLGHVLLNQDFLQWGLEAGIQNGNSMRLSFPKVSIDQLGGVPIEVQLKPMLDLLIGITTVTLEDIPIFVWLKGGAVYQQLHSDRESINDIKKVSPELFTGFGYKINEQASLHLGYQYIGGRKPTLTLYPFTERAVIRNIPVRQAIMLGFTFSFL